MVISTSQTQAESVDAGSKVRHWSTEVNDVSLHVAEQGSAAGLAVLLLHSFPEMWLSWNHQMAVLAVAAVAPSPPTSMVVVLLDHLYLPKVRPLFSSVYDPCYDCLLCLVI